MSKTKINVKNALETRNLKQIGLIIDHLRFNFKYNYMQCYEALNKKLPMSIDDYESLMYDLDCYETQEGMAQ